MSLVGQGPFYQPFHSGILPLADHPLIGAPGQLGLFCSKHGTGCISANLEQAYRQGKKKSFSLCSPHSPRPFRSVVLCPSLVPHPLPLLMTVFAFTVGSDPPTSCCFSYVSRQLHRSFVVEYYETSSHCPQPGVV